MGAFEWVLILVLMQGENEIARFGTGIWNPNFDSFSSYHECQQSIDGVGPRKDVYSWQFGEGWPFRYEHPPWNERVCGYEELRVAIEDDYHAGMTKKALEPKYGERLDRFFNCKVTIKTELRARCVPVKD
ncbi:MAG TPA: hypothetical protein EYQ14_27955 [Gammaproteobacteria bacterium]|nr:hypothetical protein [Gammaproteobacteria bacterium]